jgi:hypothetical protein
LLICLWVMILCRPVVLVQFLMKRLKDSSRWDFLIVTLFQ